MLFASGLNSAAINGAVVSLRNGKLSIRISLDDLQRVLTGVLIHLRPDELVWLTKTFTLSPSSIGTVAIAMLQGENIEQQSTAFDMLTTVKKQLETQGLTSAVVNSNLLYASESLSLMYFSRAISQSASGQENRDKAVRFGDAEREILRQSHCTKLSTCSLYDSFTEAQFLHLYSLQRETNTNRAVELLVKARAAPNSDERPDIEYVVALTGIGSDEAFADVSPADIKRAISVLDSALAKSDRRIRQLDPSAKATYSTFLRAAIGNTLVYDIRGNRAQVLMARAQCSLKLGDKQHALVDLAAVQELYQGYLASKVDIGREEFIKNYFVMLLTRSNLFGQMGDDRKAGIDALKMIELQPHDFRGYGIREGALKKQGDIEGARSVIQTGIENTSGQEQEILARELARLEKSLGSKNSTIPLNNVPYFMDHELTRGDLQGKSHRDLDLMRNEIFSRHGQTFHRQDLITYFSQFAWYHPTGDPAIYDQLTDIEKKNVQLLASFSKEQ